MFLGDDQRGHTSHGVILKDGSRYEESSCRGDISEVLRPRADPTDVKVVPCFQVFLPGSGSSMGAKGLEGRGKMEQPCIDLRHRSSDQSIGVPLKITKNLLDQE